MSSFLSISLKHAITSDDKILFCSWLYTKTEEESSFSYVFE